MVRITYREGEIFIKIKGKPQHRIYFIASVIMIFIVAISAASLSSFGSTGNEYNEVQQKLSVLLEQAKPYGVFAEKIYINNDFESNFATNSLTVDGTRDIGNSAGTKTNAAGNIYVKKFDSGILQLRTADTIFSGTLFQKKDDKIMFEEGNGVISVANYKNVTVSYLPNYLNIQQIINKIQNNILKYTSLPEDTKDAVVNLKDGNNCKIDISGCKEKISIVHISMAQYNKMQVGGMKITKNDDQILIVDITGDYATFQLSRYFVNGVSSSLDRADIADTVIFNLNNYVGDLYLSEVSGIIVAPKANVCVNGTSRGRVIANGFSNPSGEWHFLAKDLQSTIIPTTEETKTETQKETVTEKETGTQKETITEKETVTERETVKETQKETVTEKETPQIEEVMTESKSVRSFNALQENIQYEEINTFSYTEGVSLDPSNKNKQVKTGDEKNVSILVIISVFSGFLVSVMICRTRKKCK